MPGFTKKQKQEWAIKKQQEKHHAELDQIQKGFDRVNNLRVEAKKLEEHMYFQMYQLQRDVDRDNLKWKKIPINYGQVHWYSMYDSVEDSETTTIERNKYYANKK